MKKLLVLVGMIAIITVSAVQFSFGAEKSSYVFYGFSDDLKYCAFETYGTYDGSGFPYSNIYFIEVDKNKFAANPVALTSQNYNDLKRVRAANMKKADSLFKKFKINKSNIGKLVINTPKDSHNCSFKINAKTYGLKLIEKKAGKSTFNYDTKIFDLKLVKPGNKETSLQKDTVLPKSRGEALGYGIKSVYSKGNKVVVFVEYSKTGFEGPDYRQIAVSGKI